MKRPLVIAALFTAAIFTSSAVHAESYEERSGSGGGQAVEGAMIGAVIGTLLGAMIVNNTRQEPIVVHHYQPCRASITLSGRRQLGWPVSVHAYAMLISISFLADQWLL